MAINDLLKKGQLDISPPKGGWKAKTWYLVEASVSTGNPVHECILFTGFLNDKGNPCGYSGIHQSNCFPSGDTSISNYKYIKVIRELYEVGK